MEVLPSVLSSYWLMRQSLVLHPFSSYKDGLCRLLPPLLNMRPSRHYFCNPCVGAWTRIPLCLLAAFTHFFARSIGFTFGVIRSAHKTYPCHATSARGGISGLQSFVHLQAPTLARPPGCSHLSFIQAGRPGRLHHAFL